MGTYGDLIGFVFDDGAKDHKMTRSNDAIFDQIATGVILASAGIAHSDDGDFDRALFGRDLLVLFGRCAWHTGYYPSI